ASLIVVNSFYNIQSRIRYGEPGRIFYTNYSCIRLLCAVRSHNSHAAEIVIRQRHRVERVAVAHILLNDKPFDSDFVRGFDYALPVEIAGSDRSEVVGYILDFALEPAYRVVLHMNPERASGEHPERIRRLGAGVRQ